MFFKAKNVYKTLAESDRYVQEPLLILGYFSGISTDISGHGKSQNDDVWLTFLVQIFLAYLGELMPYPWCCPSSVVRRESCVVCRLCPP